MLEEKRIQLSLRQISKKSYVMQTRLLEIPLHGVFTRTLSVFFSFEQMVMFKGSAVGVSFHKVLTEPGCR